MDYLKAVLDPNRTFDIMNDEYKKAVKSGSGVHIHGDAKSIGKGAYCLYFKYEKGKPSQPDISYMCLATSDTWDPRKVVIKAPFREVEQAD